MRVVIRPLWHAVDAVRDRAAWILDRTSRLLYRLEERIREERTLEEQREER